MRLKPTWAFFNLNFFKKYLKFQIDETQKNTKKGNKTIITGFYNPPILSIHGKFKLKEYFFPRVVNRRSALFLYFSRNYFLFARGNIS
jgi:hypothetical protein